MPVTRNTTIIELTHDEISKILIQNVGAPWDAKVQFNCVDGELSAEIVYSQTNQKEEQNGWLR